MSLTVKTCTKDTDCPADPYGAGACCYKIESTAMPSSPTDTQKVFIASFAYYGAAKKGDNVHVCMDKASWTAYKAFGDAAGTANKWDDKNGLTYKTYCDTSSGLQTAWKTVAVLSAVTLIASSNLI